MQRFATKYKLLPLVLLCYYSNFMIEKSPSMVTRMKFVVDTFALLVGYKPTAEHYRGSEHVTIQWRISKTGLTISFKCFSWEPLG